MMEVEICWVSWNREEKQMLEGKGFETVIASPPDHDELVAEIYCDGRFVALVSRERGSGLFDLETPGPNLLEKEVIRKVDADGFRKAMEEACRRLKGGTSLDERAMELGH